MTRGKKLTAELIEAGIRDGKITREQGELLYDQLAWNDMEAARRAQEKQTRNRSPAVEASVQPTAASSNSSTVQYVYAVDRTRAVEQVESLINDRVRQGWEFVTAYASTGGVGGNFGTNVLIFRRKV